MLEESIDVLDRSVDLPSDRSTSQESFDNTLLPTLDKAIDITTFDSPEGVQSLHGLFFEKIKALRADDTKSLKDKTNEALLYAFCLAMTTKLRYLYPDYPSFDPTNGHARREALITVLRIAKKYIFAHVPHIPR